MRTYQVTAARRDGKAGIASAHEASVELDISPAGRLDALNPVELLLASLAACMLKGIERSAPMLKFDFRSASLVLNAERQDAPPLLTNISYELTIDTDEPDRRLELLHTNIRKYGTISSTLAQAVTLEGTIKRASV